VLGLTLLAYAAFFVFAAWLGTKTALVPSILIIERLSLGKAIARSWRLTRRAFWRTFGTLALVFVIVYFATSIITTPVQLLFAILGGVLNPTGGTAESMTGTLVALAAVTTVLTVIVSAIGLIVQSAATALIYIDLRMRKEGLDLELARFVEARQAGNMSVPDPYLPPTRPAAAPGAGPYGSGSAGPPATGTSPWS
jgi:membrane-anchored glycerophosphoryl diester phosphodiesterase (GDPDase)